MCVRCLKTKGESAGRERMNRLSLVRRGNWWAIEKGLSGVGNKRENGICISNRHDNSLSPAKEKLQSKRFKKLSSTELQTKSKRDERREISQFAIFGLGSNWYHFCLKRLYDFGFHLLQLERDFL